jgi:hypothetical protein
VVTEADLRQSTVAKAVADGTLPVTVDPNGHVARVPIPAGALLTPDVLTRGPALPSQGEALVGVALAPAPPRPTVWPLGTWSAWSSSQ